MSLTLVLFISATLYALVAVGCYRAGVNAGREALLDALERMSREVGADE